MNFRISKKDKTIKGTISLTPSKSISNRVLMIRALCREQFPIVNLATANDTVLLQKLLSTTSEIRNAEDAGTTFRFLTSYLAQKPGEWLLTGSNRMKERPVGILVDALRKLNADIEFVEKENFPPLKINGKKLTGGIIEIAGSISSQFVSALLMIAPTLEKGLIIRLQGESTSKPYIKMTLYLMKQFGIQYEWNENEISIARQDYQSVGMTIENDWSAASYWFEMAALADDVDLKIVGLHKNSLQGDSVIAEIMNQFGVETEFIQDGIRLTKKYPANSSSESTHTSNRTNASSIPFSYDFQAHPDLVQTLAVTCAAIGMKGEFAGVQNLRLKETDRLNALQAELKKIGAETTISDYAFQIKELKEPHPTHVTFQTYHDHRMAMSFAPLALMLGEVEIENPEVVKKSYPEFWVDMLSVGFEIQKI